MDNNDEAFVDQAVTEFTNINMESKRMLFKKEGQSNIVFRGIKARRRKYLKDIYITLLDIQWRWAFLILFAGFFVSCLLFSAIYYFITYVNGDFEDHGNVTQHSPCIISVNGYWDALLFSVETQSTIGYGAMYPHPQCWAIIPVIFLQVTFGFLLETTLLGFIFMKVARPKHRRHTLIFSHFACLCLEDGHLTLQIRLGDIRNTHLIDARLHGILIKPKVTAENHVYPLYQYDVEFHSHGMIDRLFLFYPMVLTHTITPESPLYSISPEDLSKENFELLLILEGTIESTGEMLQAKSCISSTEIRWGCRFAQIEEYDAINDKWYINFKNFNKVVPSVTPRISAKELSVKPSLLPEADPKEG